MCSRFSSANDPDVVFIVAIRTGVDNQQDHHLPHQADRMPALFAILETIRHQQIERIVEKYDTLIRR
jgi:hypothetical protein